MALDLVAVDVAARVTGYDPKTLRQLYEAGKVDGEDSVEIGKMGRRLRPLFLSVQSILRYKSRRWKKRVEISQAYRPGSRELVCLNCVVPGGCRESDPRCKYHNQKGD